MKNVKGTFYRIRNLPDFNGRCKRFKMECDSVPRTVKLADLWLCCKWEALDYSLKDVPTRRTVLCCELTNTLEKSERKGVINRRSRWRTGLPIWAWKIFSPKFYVIVLNQVQEVRTRTPNLCRVHFNIIIPRLNEEGEVQVKVFLVLILCVILSLFRRLRHAASLFGGTIFGSQHLEERSSTFHRSAGQIQQYIVKPTTALSKYLKQ